MIDISRHLQEYEDYLLLKNFSLQTRKLYLKTLRKFLEFCILRKFELPLSQDYARAYILCRIKSQMAWATINCDYSALRKYFKEVLHYEWSLKKVPRPRQEKTLRHILSQQDVVKLIEHASCYKHQIFLAFIYITGLRLSEATHITMDDIDSNRLQIRVNKGKGAKDRIVQIPAVLIDILRAYYIKCRPVHYLFNGRYKGTVFSAAQWAIRQARSKAKITKKASLHTLRHCYATHHIESGTDLVFLQQQLGHKHLRTTAQYVHLCMDRYRTIKHPIDQLSIQWIHPIPQQSINNP